MNLLCIKMLDIALEIRFDIGPTYRHRLHAADMRPLQTMLTDSKKEEQEECDKLHALLYPAT